MEVMRILVACEESQTVCSEFRAIGHEAYSCDIQPCSGNHPEWHILGDVLPVLNGSCDFITQDGEHHSIEGEWDMIIAHPPCTYLTNGGAVQMFRQVIEDFPPYGTFQMTNIERLKKGIQARDFFMKCLNAKCKRIAVENPTPMSIYMLPEADQIIQPYQFGEPYTKRTCLWLRGLPPLFSTVIMANKQPLINGGGGRTERPNYKGKQFATGSKSRSKTFAGIARAMADQWGAEL